jgi:hypothetical protein
LGGWRRALPDAVKLGPRRNTSSTQRRRDRRDKRRETKKRRSLEELDSLHGLARSGAQRE